MDLFVLCLGRGDRPSPGDPPELLSTGGESGGLLLLSARLRREHGRLPTAHQLPGQALCSLDGWVGLGRYKAALGPAACRSQQAAWHSGR